MMGRVDRFVTRKDVGTRKDSLENEYETASNALVERQRRANDLRVKVPVTRLEAKSESNVSSLTALAKAVAARYPLRSESESGSQKSKFDDTELEDSTVNSIDGMSYEQLVVDPHRHDQQYGEIDEAEGYAHPNTHVDDEYHHRNNMQAEDISQIHGPALFDEIDAARRVLNARYFPAQTPLPNFIQDPVADRSNSPMVYRDRAPSRPRSVQKAIMPPPSRPNKPSGVVIAPIPKTHTTTFDKTSSYTDSSANRTPPSPEDRTEKKKKRPISEVLDYEPAVLRNMSFSDLDNQPFDSDPRRSTDAAASTSSLELHLQRLATLKSLSESERAKFFSAQTKDQWAASTEFFEKRLSELFAELRAARDRRRDVALRFEGQVRERMGLVTASGEVIDRCLAEMRSKARGVLPPKVGMGTPIR